MAKCNKVTKWINYNRFLVIGITIAIGVWIFTSCGTPQTESPYRTGVYVTSDELEIEYSRWIADQNTIAKKFVAAGKDLEKQQAGQNELKKIIVDVANGDITSGKTLLLTLLTGTAGGSLIDNIRKRGLISGLKANVKANGTQTKTPT